MAQPAESTLEMARRHVRDGERRVARQEAIVVSLEKARHTEAAERGRTVLETIRTSLAMMKRHLLEIEARAKR